MKIFFLIITVFFCLVPVYSQQHYVLHVSAEWMDTFATEIRYTGDYSGTGVTSFDIGPYSSPFTVTLTVVNTHEQALLADLVFVYWSGNGSASGESVTVTVDDANPEVDAVAVYANIEPTPPASSGTGYMWLDPTKKTVAPSGAFTWELHADTGSQRLAAYDVDISWPVPQGGVIMTVDTSNGTNGVDAGVEGFVAAAEADNAMGTLHIAGFDTHGTGPSNDLHVCTVHFKAGSREVTGASVSVVVGDMVDETVSPIGMGMGMEAVIVIEGDEEFFLGDVNDDGRITIIDALLVAQYYVGLEPAQYTAPVEAGDSNQDGNVNIIDALMMAQYYVGICDCPYFPPLHG
ncbi:MAG: dockerin type I repeat-containing protein [Spirochaetales bacterium]|nr:dockerin type I repeat-containing protein [Spirochaetales bacterium]